MEPLFKVGDIVRIKKDLDKYIRAPFGVSDKMLPLAGKKFRITSVGINAYNPEYFPGVDGCDKCRYRIDGDSGEWSWSSPMLEKVNTLEKALEKIGILGEDTKPLKLVVKKHTIKLNFKN